MVSRSSAAACSTWSASSAKRTAPALPRRPVGISALTTAPPDQPRMISAAACGVEAMRPRGTAIPRSRSHDFTLSSVARNAALLTYVIERLAQGSFAPVRSAFFDEGRNALKAIGRRREPLLTECLDHQRGLDIGLQSVVDAQLGHADGVRRIAGELFRGGKAGRKQLVAGQDLVDDSPGQGVLRTKLLASQDHLFCPRFADDAGKSLCASRSGHEAALDFRKSECGMLCCIAEVRSQHNFGTATKRNPVNGANHRNWAALH